MTFLVGSLLGTLVGVLWTRLRGASELADLTSRLSRASAERDAAHDRLGELVGERRAARAELSGQAVVKDSLERLHAHLTELERNRSSWQGALKQQVDDIRAMGDNLRKETAALATALRRPQVRGRWGELHLQRAVELAGLVEHCDFVQQSEARIGDQRLRPDLVVHLAGGRRVVVDAKVPLEAFLDATSTEDPRERAEQLDRHARQLRQHVEALAGKSYWRGLDNSVEFVVLFVPAESFLAAALEADPQVLEYAAARQVVLATPTTLIALLRTVAHAWTQQALAENTREIHGLGRELYERLGSVGDHLDKLGRSLTASVRGYNAAVGSLESRVLVSARRLRDLQVSDEPLAGPSPVEEAVRPLTAPELLEDSA